MSSFFNVNAMCARVSFATRRFVIVALAIVSPVLLTACASAPDASDPEALAEYRQINDPLEPLNRGIFFLNEGVDTLAIRPLSIFYKGMTPPPFQTGVHNFLNNLKAPVVFLNALLQGDGARAQTVLIRFVINSTVGVLGLADFATDWGYEMQSEDFGQTLAVWGSDSGPYLVLPLFGPSNPRDAVGMAVDMIVDPVRHWAGNSNREWVTPTRTTLRAADFRSRNDSEIEDLKKSSLDYYASVRSLYRQHRAHQIGNGAPLDPMTVPGSTDFSSVK